MEEYVGGFGRGGKVMRSPVRKEWEGDENNENKEKRSDSKEQQAKTGKEEEERRNRRGYDQELEMERMVEQISQKVAANLRKELGEEMRDIKNIKNMLQTEIGEIKKEIERKEKEWQKEIERKEKEWQIEKKLMNVRLEELEEKVRRQENRTKEEALTERIAVIMEKKKKEEKESIGSIQNEEGWLQRMERKVEQFMEKKNKGEAKMIEHIDIRMEREERRRRRSNMIIRGVRFEGKNLKREVEEFLEREMHVKSRIERATKLRSENNNDNGILVQLESLDKKREILGNRRYLKGTRIFLDDDMTRKEREIHKEIWARAKKEEARGRSVKKGYMKLIINQECWRWNERTDKLEKRNF